MAVDIAPENARLDGFTIHSFGAVQTGSVSPEPHQLGDWTVAGFARSPSYDVGEQAKFCVNGPAVQIDIYRVGYYAGAGFKIVDTIVNTPTTQPEAIVIPNTNGATSCSNWAVTATWNIPTNATSGYYLAAVRSVGANAPNAFYITFIVRDDAAEADIIFKASDATWGAAYNHYGTPSAINSGKNVYGSGQGIGAIQNRSLAVSYHRPVLTRGGVDQTYWWNAELPMIRWLERNGYKVKYVTCVDLDKQGEALLEKGKIFLSIGHDEYWSRNMRDAVENWRDAGPNHSIFMSGNEVFWKTRYVYNGDESVMVCYKDTMPGPTASHPSHLPGQAIDPVEWTGTWKDTRWPGRRPEWLLTGTDFRMNGVHDHDATIISNPYGGHKVWDATSLTTGPITIQKIIGMEADAYRPTQPDGSFALLAAYTRDISPYKADDNGENYNQSGDLNWGVVSQRYDSGAVTVGFGTCQWSWALDSTHDRGVSVVSTPAQQMTVTLLRDLGATPETPQVNVQLLTPNSLDVYGLIPGFDDNVTDEDSNILLGDGSMLTASLGDGTPLRLSLISQNE